MLPTSSPGARATLRAAPPMSPHHCPPPLCAKASCSMTPAQWLLDETRDWIVHARRDLRASELCAAELPAEALYHCQQAAEKFLKALPTFHQTPFPKTHEIRELAMACAAIDASLEPEIRNAASALTRYAWLFRYP